MSFMMTNAPQMAFAETVQSSAMIPTSSVVAALTEAEAKTRINNFLQRDDVKAQLVARGLTVEEASLRVASLSKVEMNNLVSQMDQARAGGDILITILVIILIIFLIQRI